MTRPQSARPESPVERFFLPQPLQLATQATVELDGSEAHHLLHVLRAKVGDRVGLFNGQGGEAVAELVNHRKRAAELRILDVWTTPAESNELILATALPKGDRARWLVEKATELGVTRIIPLRTTRSVVEPGEGKMDKLMQAAIAACKQCGRSRLPRLDPLTSLNDVLREVTSNSLPSVTLLADPKSDRTIPQAIAAAASPPSTILALIGPEGGFTEDEHTAAIAVGATAVRLGTHILRIETAALAIVVACQVVR